jgi:hypothetical protein
MRIYLEETATGVTDPRSGPIVLTHKYAKFLPLIKKAARYNDRYSVLAGMCIICRFNSLHRQGIIPSSPPKNRLLLIEGFEKVGCSEKQL